MWKFARDRNLKNGLISGLATGLSQIAKMTALALYPIFFICLFLYDLPVLISAYRNRAFETLKRYIWQYILYAGALLLISLFIINIGYVFDHTLTPFGDYAFRSRLFQIIQDHFVVLKNIPVPVPYPYLQGLDLLLQTDPKSMLHGSIYLLGQIHGDDSGFKGYYFFASLLKMPIATQLILLAAALVYISDREQWKHFLSDEVFLILPVVFYTIYFNFFLDSQIGIRYYLIVFPLLYVFSGSFFKEWSQFSRKKRAAIFALAIYMIVSVLSYYPYYLSYFNEIVWDRRYAYKYLADSNLDWAQGQYYLNAYLEVHPTAKYMPSRPRSGLIIVPANFLVGIQPKNDTELYKWLRENFQPTQTIAYEYLVFNISPHELKQFCATTTYCH